MNEVEEIKEKIDIVDFIGGYLQLKKAGQNYKALCPFHNEKTPSFMVNPERQIFKCFGCGEGGDVFEFLMKMENLDFKEALEILSEKTGVKLKKSRKQVWNNFENPSDMSSNTNKISKKRLYDINLLSARVFNKILLDHSSAKKALDYLIQKRGLTKKTIQEFLIGYAPPKNILSSFLKKKGISNLEAQRAGSPDRFFNRIVFPITDILGNMVGFTGRAMDDSQMPKYLNTAETVIFNKSKLLYGLNMAKTDIKTQEKVVLVEGQMDVILSYQSGIKNTVASSGTALTPEQLKIISRFDSEIILAYDQDEAGAKAVQKAIDLILSAGIDARIASWPNDYKDPGEVVVASMELWKKSINEAVPYFDWLLETLIKKYGRETSVQKKKIAREILPLLAKISNDIEKSHWIKITANKLEVGEQNIIDALDKISLRSKSQYGMQTIEPSIENEKKRIEPEEELLTLLISKKELWDKYQSAVSGDIYTRLRKDYSKIKDPEGLEKVLGVEIAKKIKNWTFELERLYDFNDISSLEKGVENFLVKLKEKEREKLKQKFAFAINQAEKENNREKIKELLKEFQDKIKEP